MPQTSSASPRILAPAATYSSSWIDEPDARALLDEDLVTVRGQLVHTDRA